MSKESQVGGSHYASKKIDPFTFAMANNWDPMLFSILKYLTRYKDKGTPLQDLQKAMHIAEYRKKFPPPKMQELEISVGYYRCVNDLDLDVEQILVLIEKQHERVPVADFNSTMDTVIGLIKKIHEDATGLGLRPQGGQVTQFVDYSVVTSKEQAEKQGREQLAAILRDEKHKADRT